MRTGGQCALKDFRSSARFRRRLGQGFKSIRIGHATSASATTLPAQMATSQLRRLMVVRMVAVVADLAAEHPIGPGSIGQD